MMPTSISRILLLMCFALIVLIAVKSGGAVNAFTGLIPMKVYPGWEMWRLVTYPVGAWWFGIMVGLFAFYSPAEELEGMLGRRNFGLLLLAFTLASGLLFLLMASSHNLAMYGPGNLGLFILIGYLYLFPKSTITFFFFFRIRTWILVTVIALAVVGESFMVEGSLLVVVRILGDGWLGLILGAAYFHARFQKYPFLLRPIRSMERAATFNRVNSERVPAAQEPRRVSLQAQTRARTPFQKGVAREMSDEERLNAILEKISEKSYNALSEEEKKFLREYSGRL
ncbi:MAG TPA: DUF6576 domain-containing protein [Candidatus Kapabacteria bacterium]|nr:DUF6576 domain-containing protein [Candidatus Kapabacteria bacterium]